MLDGCSAILTIGDEDKEGSRVSSLSAFRYSNSPDQGRQMGKEETSKDKNEYLNLFHMRNIQTEMSNE